MSSGMMPADWVLSADSYITSTKTEITGTITNLPNIAGTWGKFIPVSWGNVRLGGYQIWSSAFYKITDTTTTKLVDNWQYLNPDNFLAANMGGPIFPGNEVYNERVSVDVAYSFGYNGMESNRVVTKIRMDQNVIYDQAGGATQTTDYAFTVRMGNEDYPEPVMVARATDPENVVYYPGQIVITFAGLEGAYLGNKNTKSPLPTSVDIEIKNISGPAYAGIIGETVQRDFVGGGLATAWTDANIMPDYERKLAYVYEKRVGGKTVRVYSLPDIKRMKDIELQVSTPVREGAVFAWMIYLSGLKLLAAQHEGPNTDGSSSAIFLFDAETGQQIETMGTTAWNFETNPGPLGIPSLVAAQLVSDTANSARINGSTNQGSRTAYTIRFVRNGPRIEIIPDRTSGALPDVFPNQITRGSGDIGYARIGRDIYTVGANGYTLAFTVSPEDFSLGVTTVFTSYNGDLIIASDPAKIIRYRKDGTKVYEKNYQQGTDIPSNIWIVNPFSTQDNARAAGLVRGNGPHLYGAYGNNYSYVLNLDNGDLVIHPILPNTEGPVPNILGAVLFWDDVNGWAIDASTIGQQSSGYINIPIAREGERILLRDFLRSLYVNTGRFTADQIEFSGIDDTIVGALLTKAYPLETIVNNTCTLFNIQRLETRDRIKFYRNRPIIGDAEIAFDISIDDLALVKESEGDRAAMVSTIADSQKTVAEIKLTFIDFEADYNENSVVWRRPDAPADATTVLNITTIIVMSKTEALQLVQIRYQDSVTSATRHQLRLPPAYSDVYKGDIIRVKHRGFTSVMKVTETGLNADNSVSLWADSVTLERRAIADIPDKTNTQVGAALGEGPMFGVSLDMAALHVAHLGGDGFPFYYLAHGDNPSWAGGYVVRGRAGEPEGRLFEVTARPAFAAYIVPTALPDRPWSIEPAPVPLTFVGGTWNPERNTTIAEILKDKTRNLAIYGAPGRWEIMQIASVANNVATGIVRGLNGTDVYCGKHVAGDKLYLIDQFLVMEQRPNSVIGGTDFIKAVSYWQRFIEATAEPIVVTGEALRPWAPVFIEGEASGGDIVLTWARRDRKGMSAFEDVPMSEAAELYSVDIMLNGTAVRTIDGINAQTVTYTEAQRAEDGTDTLTELDVIVYQISAVVGRGRPGKAKVNVG